MRRESTGNLIETGETQISSLCREQSVPSCGAQKSSQVSAQSRTAVAPIQTLFEDQVYRTPDAIAVVCEGHSITYSELNERANQLAGYLRTRGVLPDQRVGMCLDRCIELIIGIVGILKAGAAYVPLDPSYPIERRAYTLADAAPKMLLTQERLRQTMPVTAATLITLDSDWHEIAKQVPSNVDAGILGLCPAHAAYVIYTSGSTGRPKGVVVEHRNVTRLFSETSRWFNFSDRDVWALFHSISFDFSVWEVWGALLYGGRLVIVPYLLARSPQDFYRLLCVEGITVLNQTPSAFAQLVEAQARSAEAHSLRVVIFGGEALELRLLRAWVERNGAEQPRLVNMYGITETTVHVTYYPLTSDDVESGVRSPIGSAIPDLRVHLLDDRQRPVPIDALGEIYVGGPGLARGYLNQPELTAERFIADPLSTESNSRLYKTGDLGRWQADGTVEYLGRNDRQVKIRGFRIELGEIESQLTRLEEVKDAVVVVREDIPGENRLVAYVVLARKYGSARNSNPAREDDNPMADDERAQVVSHLRDALKTQLPEHMVPSAIVILKRLPLTPNGKLDRQNFPEPDYGGHVAKQYSPPDGVIEVALERIWADILRVERVGRRDNFFDLGGHSLQGIRLTASVAERFGVELPPFSIFTHPTIQQMSEVIYKRLSEKPVSTNRAELEEFRF